MEAHDMMRDMNLVREILIWSVSQHGSMIGKNPSIDGYSEEQISHHVYLMAQAGLVESRNIQSSSRPYPAGLLISVTWEGHDFADAAKNESTWKKVAVPIISEGASFTFALLKESLSQYAKGVLGLP